MSDLIQSGESEEVKAAPADIKGMIGFAGWVLSGLFLVLGFSLVGLIGGTSKKTTKESKSDKDDEDTVADYDKEYLDEDISEDALDEHTVGMTA
jgi:hypothetical protein